MLPARLFTQLPSQVEQVGQPAGRSSHTTHWPGPASGGGAQTGCSSATRTGSAFDDEDATNTLLVSTPDGDEVLKAKRELKYERTDGGWCPTVDWSLDGGR
jgi:hypothetical protein